MKPYKNDRKICWGAAACVLAAMLVVMASSCRRTTRCCHGDDAYYAQVDSLMGAITDADTLAARAQSYHDAGDQVGEMVALRYRGIILCRQSRFDEAIAVHNRGLQLATSAADTIEMALAYNNIASDCRLGGNLSDANGFFYKSLQLIDGYSDRSSDEALGVRVSTLEGIGMIEIGLRRFASADSLLREALKGEQVLGNEMGMALNYSHLGAIKRMRGEADSAWVYYRESLKHNQLAGNQIGEAMCHLHYGELYVDENNYSRALSEFQVAYDHLRSVAPSYYWLKACLALSSVNILLGEKEDAMRYAQEAEREAIRIKNLEYQANAYRVLYELSLMSGDQQRALDYFVKSDNLYDSIYGLEKSEKMRHQLNEYEANVKQGQVQSLNKDIKRLSYTRNLMGVFTILLVLMGGAIILALLYAARVRARTQRLMRQVEETRSLFFTNVVHQLRTPLTAIMGATDAIVAQTAAGDGGEADARQRNNVEIIERQGHHLLLLVDRILEVGGVRSALKGPDWRTGDVVGYLRMIVESYREQCVDRQIELTYAPSEKEKEMDVVPAYLNTIVGNLIENSISYSNDYSKISVTSHVDGGKLVIRVADNGIGIDAADVPHVFEPFYRAAAAEQLCEGVGIGLTVVRDMATVLGGSVAVESSPGNGSVFTVTLPCHNPEQRRYEPLEMVVRPVKNRLHRHAQAPIDETDHSDGKQGCPRVLVVEDHNDVARLVGAALGPAFEAHYAVNGVQGLNMATELVPDLIITDVKMPGMDGLELCRRVRASRQLCHIPVIVLSARTSIRDRINGFEAGADVYMVKPFDGEEIKSVVTKLLENRKILKEYYSKTQSCGSVVAPLKGEMNATATDEGMLEAFAQLVEQQSTGGNVRLDLDMIATSLKMGESQLRRRIQEITGKNVAAYVTQLRMEKAMRLLREQPDLLIGEVAEQCGYGDVAYFSRVFRQYYDMTPTQARSNGDNHSSQQG